MHRLKTIVTCLKSYAEWAQPIPFFLWQCCNRLCSLIDWKTSCIKFLLKLCAACSPRSHWSTADSSGTTLQWITTHSTQSCLSCGAGVTHCLCKWFCKNCIISSSNMCQRRIFYHPILLGTDKLHLLLIFYAFRTWLFLSIGFCRFWLSLNDFFLNLATKFFEIWQYWPEPRIHCKKCGWKTFLGMELTKVLVAFILLFMMA